MAGLDPLLLTPADHVQTGGLPGTATLCGEGIAPFWPYLRLGQWVHAGKNTRMGLGRYRVKFTASLPETKRVLAAAGGFHPRLHK